MRYIVRNLLFIAAMLVALPAALADHMTGNYTGTGQAQGISLQLQQSGRTLAGALIGSATGTLEGQTDGGDNASGSVQIPGAGRFGFEGRWSQQGFNLTLIGSDGRAEFFFASSGSAPPPPPPPPPADVEYYVVENGVTVGPFTADQIRQRLALGASNPDDLVWKAGLAQWVRIDSLPEFASAPPPPPPPPPPGGGDGGEPVPPGPTPPPGEGGGGEPVPPGPTPPGPTPPGPTPPGTAPVPPSFEPGFPGRSG